jgi:hypothetical protein
MSKEITPVNRPKEKPFIEGRIVYDDNKQESHDHGMFSQ